MVVYGGPLVTNIDTHTKPLSWYESKILESIPYGYLPLFERVCDVYIWLAR